MSTPSEQFSLIYDQYIDKIYRFVYVKVNSKELAEDITSRVFMKGWEAFKGGTQKIQNPSAFLYQIARNMVVDHYRQKGGSQTVSPDTVAEPIDAKANIHEAALAKNDLEVIKAGLMDLKQEYQDVLVWHYLEDMSIAEIATMLEKPEGTVRVTLHRGLNALRERVQEA